MAKRKAAKKNDAVDGQTTNDGVEPMVIPLAEQLGSFMGRVQAKALRLGKSPSSKKTPRSGQADGWLERDALRQQLGQIRDGATQLLDRMNRAGAAVKKTVTKSAAAVKSSAVAAEKAAGASTTRASRGPVDAPGKRHRKPPPQESINKRMGEPKGKNAGQKQFKVGKSRGRG